MKDIWKCKGCKHLRKKQKSTCTIILEGHEDSPIAPYRCPWNGGDTTAEFIKQKSKEIFSPSHCKNYVESIIRMGACDNRPSNGKCKSCPQWHQLKTCSACNQVIE
jgi:hypothetical protein